MLDNSNLNSLLGAPITDADGDKIGTVGQIYVDPDTDQATWVTVKTGLFGTSETFAPLEHATWDDDTLTVPFEKEFVKNAPRVEADGALSEENEKALYTYYGNGSQSASDAAHAPSTAASTETEGYDTSGPTTDDAMTRSEEELNVGTRSVEAGRARLRKFVVTEQQTVTVPVSHDEVRLVREPVTDANVGDALDGPEISEEEHEIVLTADQVVVDKEVVPVERISLGSETVTEQQQITEEVRTEQVELVDPTGIGTSADTDGREPRDPRASE
ncbi:MULTISPECIES: PRC and DUF2382 domain-containing protein [Cryobacterium]|uniref:DUF2382 domain-containing protein n=1 Tax=Cryobacterium breve TaxID=1259258 RepID=A0ABY2J493_9MICO|nr:MULTISPECIES: PRC and DUF2382 domain-containing protein [Cryobacterium]TFC94103.1 DUF2382 domain-containing protein [Cryobacterium sp. TmT3-12]TFC98666.1 DUF2382 domain-containing protein [Cryobacterium breve]